MQRLRHYRRSSYRVYVGLEKAPEWLTCDVGLEWGGGGTVGQRQRAYPKYVEEAVRQGLEQCPWEHLEGQFVLGPQRSFEALRKQIGGLSREHPRPRALTPRPRWEQVFQAVESVRGSKWEEFRDRYGDWVWVDKITSARLKGTSTRRPDSTL